MSASSPLATSPSLMAVKQIPGTGISAYCLQPQSVEKGEIDILRGTIVFLG